jgi:hypothetical protein
VSVVETKDDRSRENYETGVPPYPNRELLRPKERPTAFKTQSFHNLLA